MTIRNLAGTLRPASIAIVGASNREGELGRVVTENIISGGYSGAIYPVSRDYDQVLGFQCYQQVADLPQAPELAILAIPARDTPAAVSELGERGVPAAVVLAGGFDDDLREQLCEAARPFSLRLIGPNTIGLLAPQVRLNASFAHIAPEPGRLGLISQSGAIISSIIDWAAAERIGFSQIFSLGDTVDVDAGDCLNLLAEDARTSAILLYLESVTAPRKFMSAARAAAQIKPVIAIKAGRHDPTTQLTQLRTGVASGEDRVIEAAFRRAGIIRVDKLEDLFAAAEIRARFQPLDRGRTAIITNGGGAGILAVDHLLERGCEMTSLAPHTVAALDTVLPAAWSRCNPVDILGDAPPERYKAAVEIIASDPGVDALLVMNTPTALASSTDAARAVASLAQEGMVRGKPVLACWLGKFTAEHARTMFKASGIASIETPAAAAEAVELLTRWSTLRHLVERVPENAVQFRTDRVVAARTFRKVAQSGRHALSEAEAKSVIAAYGIPVPEMQVAADENEVEHWAAEMLGRYKALAIKLHSHTIFYKSELGGVVLGVESATAAREAARAIRTRLREHGRDAEIEGFSIQPMIRRPHARELMVGLRADPVFGPTALFGSGGLAADVVDDMAVGLVPLDEVLAGDLIEQTRISRQLGSYANVPPADRLAIERTLMGLSQLAIDFPCVTGARINPLLADEHGVIALDANIEIDPARIDERGPGACLAIRPYPSGWEVRAAVRDRAFVIRPMRPVDAALYSAFMARMDAEDLRLRFLAPTQQLSRDMLVSFTQLDYDREIAFVALEEPGGEMAGVVRYSADPDHERAEFGIIVRSDLKGFGLGKILLGRLIAYARADGLRWLDGVVLRENAGMLGLARRFGFASQPGPEDSTLSRISLALDGAPPLDPPVENRLKTTAP